MGADDAAAPCPHGGWGAARRLLASSSRVKAARGAGCGGRRVAAARPPGATPATRAPPTGAPGAAHTRSRGRRAPQKQRRRPAGSPAPARRGGGPAARRGGGPRCGARRACRTSTPGTARGPGDARPRRHRLRLRDLAAVIRQTRRPGGAQAPAATKWGRPRARSPPRTHLSPARRPAHSNIRAHHQPATSPASTYEPSQAPQACHL
jgi:hypothetical protein